MPKTINTPREELICGKLDLLVEMVKNGNIVNSIYLIEDIRHDAQRMEAKLIIRKQEAFGKIKLSYGTKKHKCR